ncbi:MAG: hydrogenase nickel incorporation protein HypB [Clostridia bacterium]
MTKLDVRQDVKALNDLKAAENHGVFDTTGVLVIDMMGSPGAGKTTLLENILPALSAQLKAAVIEGDLATENDALRISKTGVQAIQINTGGGCHLDAGMIALELSKLELDKLDLLIIENVGNLVCPASFALGEDIRMVVLSLAEGDDKPEKYPVAFLHADVAVITKTDLAPYVDADTEKMKRSISSINPDTLIFEASKHGKQYDVKGLVDFLVRRVEEKRSK